MYVRVEWPESQKWMGEEYDGEVEYADDMAVFVPEELYYGTGN